MSQFPSMNDPGAAPNPFGAPTTGYPPPRRSNVWLWILLGAGGMGVLVCCGCAGMMFFGWNQAMGVLGTETVKSLNQDPTAQQHLGTVNSASFDVMATGEATKKQGQNVLVFHVQGSKGKGDVFAEQSPGPQPFKNARLVLPGGEEFDLGF